MNKIAVLKLMLISLLAVMGIVIISVLTMMVWAIVTGVDLRKVLRLIEMKVNPLMVLRMICA